MTTQLWFDSIYKTAIAKTRESFDPVDQNKAQIKVQKENADTLIGLLVNYCATKQTDAELIPDLVIRVTSEVHGLVNREVVVLNGTSDADALAMYTPMNVEFIPFTIDSGKPLYNSDFSFSVAPSSDFTGGLDVVITLVYGNGEPDEALLRELFAMKTVGLGTQESDPAKAHATADQAVSLTSLTIPVGATQLRALLAQVKPNDIVVDDPASGIVEFISADITDFSPQVLPFAVFWNAVLGTVTNAQTISGKGKYYPTRFPLSGNGATITASSRLLVAAGAAPDIIIGAKYDQ